MKKLAILLVVIMLVAGLFAGCDFLDWLFPKEKLITITWFEDAKRYYADGSDHSGWTNDPLGPAKLIQDNGGWCFADINQYFNWNMTEEMGLEGILFITKTGLLSGYATYTSGLSGLPIRENFKGEVVIIVYDEEEVIEYDGTMAGTYTQWSYAYAESDNAVAMAELNEHYKNAVLAPIIGIDWWFIGHTDYIAY